MATLSTPLPKQEVTRFARFLTVGAIGTLLDFSILTLLKLAELPTLAANSLSFAAGLLNNFTWNRLWTFRDTVNIDWRRQLVQFTMVSLVGLGLSNLIVLSLEGIFSTWLGSAQWSYLPAKVLATGVVVFWNYFANRTWTFKHLDHTR